MCHDCSRKAATIVAALLASGTPQFEPDDRDPQENRDERKAIQDAARLIAIHRGREVANKTELPLVPEPIAAQVVALMEEIGPSRLAYAAEVLRFYRDALEGARELAALTISGLANAGNVGAMKWMQRVGSQHGFSQEIAVSPLSMMVPRRRGKEELN